MAERIEINRAPVLTLWGVVVAQRMGYDRDAALTLGRCLAGLNAQAKGRRLGIFGKPASIDGRPPKKVGLGEEFWIELCGRALPAKNTPAGIRAVVENAPIDPAAVQRYLEGKFGPALAAAQEAMRGLAKAFGLEELPAAAFGLYEKFRPQIPPGRAGWGAKGVLDLKRIGSLAKYSPRPAGRRSSSSRSL
jgi:hypothetical protein